MFDPAKWKPWRLVSFAFVGGCALAAITFAAMSQLRAAVIVAGVLAAVVVVRAVTSLVLALLSGEHEREEPLSAERRRELLEEKVFLLARIRELEFDRAVGKMSEEDHKDAVIAARDRALEVMRELEGASSVRSLIERELAERLASRKIPAKLAPRPQPRPAGPASREQACPACQAPMPADARFCHRCGVPLSKEKVS